MLRRRFRPLLLAGAALLALLPLSGCLVRGEDGTSWLSLDWVYQPRQADFPAIDSDIYVQGTYYEHGEGDYFARYVAWDGSYHEFVYTIEVNPGSYGYPGAYGLDGADRYYVMELYASGPELWYVDEAAPRAAGRSLSPGGGSLEAGGAAPDPARVDLDHPRPYRWEKEGDGWRVRIEGRSYPPRS